MKDIFNGDETYMYIQQQNICSYTMNNNVNKEKNNNKKVTLLLCCSATSEKLPPLFIGKSKNPRSFKNNTLVNETFYYFSNKSSWMNTGKMNSWLQNINEYF